MPKKVLAVFDFDGTLTNRDTLWSFLIFSKGWRSFFFALLKNSFSLFLALIGFKSRSDAKEALYRTCFKGVEKREFNNLCKKFAVNGQKYIRDEAQRRVEYHRSLKHEIVIVTASPIDWVIPIAYSVGITKVIGTELEIDKRGALTGNFSTKNCFGAEKVYRLEKEYGRLGNFEIYAYGDSIGDKEMLSIATHKFYRRFW